MVYGQRPGCPSDRHGSVRAGRKYGCRCEDTREAQLARGRRYRAGAAYQASRESLAAARRVERTLTVEAFFRAEREETVRRMTLAGQSAQEISIKVGRTPRSVVRIRNKLRRLGKLPSIQVDIRTEGELGLQHDRDERSSTECPDQHVFVPAGHHAEG